MGNIPNSTTLRQCFHWLNVKYKDIFFDHRTRELTTGKAILLLLEARLKQRKSLDDVAGNLEATSWLQKWLELESIDSSTLNRKLGKLPLCLLQEVFSTLVQEIAQHYAGKTGNGNLGKLSVIDSTELTLPHAYGIWGFMSDNQNGVKVHTKLVVGDENSVNPEQIVLSTIGVSDQNNKVLMELVVESENTYVFDRGYINYKNYIKWANRKIRFVARVKSNNTGRILATRTPDEGSDIVLDADTEVKDPDSREVMKLRLVEYTYVNKNKEVKKIRVMTNRWDLSAKEISEIYRYRWKVELFFKWMKQHVNLKKLYSYKENAVWNQILLSFIAYALCELIRLKVKPEKSCWFILKNILRYADQSVELWLEALNRVPNRTSKGRRKKGKPGRPRLYPKKYKTAQIIIT